MTSSRFRFFAMANLLLMVGFTTYAQHPEGEVVRENRASGVLEKTLIIHDREFNESRLNEIAEHFILNETDGIALAMLMIGTDAINIARSTAKMRATFTYDASLAASAEYGVPQHVARVLFYNGSATLSVRNAADSLFRRAITGPDARIFLKQGSVEFELLTFRVVTNRAALTSQDRFSLEVFLKADGATVDSAAAVTARLRHVTGVGQVTTASRSDPWFIGFQSYPDIFPFSRDTQIPPKQELNAKPTIVCIAGHRRSGCNVYQDMK